jgi:sugar phosphate permease
MKGIQLLNTCVHDVPRLRRMQTRSLSLLVAAGTLNYLDRGALAIANPRIRDDLGLSIEQMGVLLSAFLWAYALSQIPGGALVDRLGARRLLGGALALWSMAQSAAGLSVNLIQFVIARGVLGMGEAPMYPSATWVTRAWFPLERRALVTGTWNSSSTLGPTLAPPLLTALMLTFGWRAMFVMLGVFGLLLALAWSVLYRDPFEETGAPTTAMLAVPTLTDWCGLFNRKVTWGLVLGYFGIIHLLWLFSSWLPGYLEIQHHMDVRTTAWVAAIPFALGICGNLSSGWLADRLLREGYNPLAIRRTIILAAMLAMAVFTFAAAYAHTPDWAIACISGALFCNGASTTMMWCLVSEVAPSNLTASLGGIINCGGYLGGALAPLATGYIAQRTGSFMLAMDLAAAIATLSAIAFFVLLRTGVTDSARQSLRTSV